MFEPESEFESRAADVEVSALERLLADEPNRESSNGDKLSTWEYIREMNRVRSNLENLGRWYHQLEAANASEGAKQALAELEKLGMAVAKSASKLAAANYA